MLRPGSLSAPAGGVVSRCHVHVAGLGSVLPAGSVARMSTVCWLSVRPLNVFGLVQALQAPPSIRHSNVEPASVAPKLKVAAALLGSAGLPVMTVSGGVVSTKTL